jgi:uncharacterized protein YceH (UPF0502 family)
MRYLRHNLGNNLIKMTVNIAGHMVRKSITKDTSGNIINLIDEKDGGWIIRNRRVVNEEKWNDLLQKEQDKREAALAATKAVAASSEAQAARNAPAGAVPQSDKVAALEERLNKQDEKLDAILAALKK